MDRLLRTSFKLSTLTPPSIGMKQPSIQHCPFPGQLLATDSISWVVFECIEVNEDSFFHDAGDDREHGAEDAVREV